MRGICQLEVERQFSTICFLMKNESIHSMARHLLVSFASRMSSIPYFLEAFSSLNHKNFISSFSTLYSDSTIRCHGLEYASKHTHRKRRLTSKRRQEFSAKRVVVSSNYILTGTQDDESKEANKKNKCLLNKYSPCHQ